MSTIRRNPQVSFGVDAPVVPIAFAAAGVTIGAVGATVQRITHRKWPAAVAAAYGGWFAAAAGAYLHTTLRGKFIVWESILDELDLRGDERALDLGCGRGAVLLAAARRLSTGTAIGVDLWRSSDQSGNNADATWRNARGLGVAERVDLRTGDMTKLDIQDGTVDVVLSNLAIHNVPNAEGRAMAVREAARVLRPGGKLALVDFRHVADYERELIESKLVHIRRRGLGWKFWYGNPVGGTQLLTATKPAA